MADILVADDTRSIRTALTILLEEYGHTVRLASNGDEALSEYRKRRPDMLLLHPEIEESLKPKEKKKRRRTSDV